MGEISVIDLTHVELCENNPGVVERLYWSHDVRISANFNIFTKFGSLVNENTNGDRQPSSRWRATAI